MTRTLPPRTIAEGLPRAKAAASGPTKDQVQRAVMRALAVAGAPGICAWHTPNGGKRGVIEAERLKGQGVKAGIPDVFILSKGQLFGLELKAARGSVSTAHQDMQRLLCAAGATIATAYGFDDATATLAA